MAPTPDELAGTVDGFGGLTRAELAAALGDLAARTGDDLDPAGLDAAVDGALEDYYLLELDPPTVEVPDRDEVPEGPLLVPGPAALPTLPPGGEDLPHLLDVEPRRIDREAAARQAEGRLRADAATAIARDDAASAERLLDACYEVESWGPVALDDAKAGLRAVLDSSADDGERPPPSPHD